MQFSDNCFVSSQNTKKITWFISLIFVITLLYNQTALAKHVNYRHYKQFKYAKEEFRPRPRLWGSLEYMNMWEQSGPVSIPLVTQNNDPAALGIIGEPGTQIIYGDGSGQDLAYGNISGGRITLGGWIDDRDLYGIEFSGFLLEKKYTNFEASSPGGDFPVVSIPFFSTSPVPAGEAAVSAKSPFSTNNPNNISVHTGSQLWGAELNWVYNLTNRTRYPLQALAGFRYMSLDESLTLNDTIFDTTGTRPTMGVLSYSDDFNTQNNFYGIQFGLRSNWVAQNGFTLDILAKVALGENAEVIDISGNTTSTKAAMGVATGTYNSGIFAQESNMGSYDHNTFAVLPEFQLKLGYLPSPNVHPYIGYDGMYMNKVVRPGEQINRNINTTESVALSGGTTVSGALSPTKPSFNNTSFWIQGVTVGIEVRL